MSRSTFRKAAVGLMAAALTAAGLAGPASADGGDAGWTSMPTTEARTDNPLKGFMPFGLENHHQDFPHTMEWFYLPLNEVVKGDKVYDWSSFDQKLDTIAARGHQSVLRFFLDYPGRPTGVPDYLLGSDGIDQSRRYTFFDNEKISFSPDYDDPRVQALITDFIKAFGERYDGDPRIGFITTGLVGFWGEQHTWPMNGYADKDAGNPDGENWMPKREVELGFTARGTPRSTPPRSSTVTRSRDSRTSRWASTMTRSPSRPCPMSTGTSWHT